LIGRVDITGGATGGSTERLYYVKDHPPQSHWGASLGSTRLTLSAVNTANNNIIFASDYYPFGETIREYTTGINRYKFTEKERDAETAYDYFGARYYNNKLGVWLSVDPIGTKYPSWSPYNYVKNNPLNFRDEQGDSLKGIYIPNSGCIYIDTKIVENLLTIKAVAEKEGISVVFKSTYRTEEQQEKQKEKWTKMGKPQNAAKPLTSIHEAGFGIDFDNKKMNKSQLSRFLEIANENGFKKTNSEAWHLEADPKKFNYKDKYEAIKENHADFQRAEYELGKNLIKYTYK
jgi:RHS repeat-associated protein